MNNKKFNKSKFHYRIVALIFTAIIMVGIFGFGNIVSSQSAPDTPTYKWNGTTYYYNGSGVWTDPSTGNTSNIPTNILDKTTQANVNTYDAYISKTSQTAKNTPGTIKAGSTYVDPDNNKWFYSTDDGLWHEAYIDNTTTKTTKEINDMAKTSTAAMATAEPTTMEGYIGQVVGNTASFFAKGIASTVAAVFSISIQFVLIPIASFFLAAAGMVLDYAVQYTIYGTGFSTMTGSIQGVWVLIRDVANIFFIFMLLYVAIKQIILGETAKEILKSVIISAFLINFSLFITGVIIDANNLVATSLYNQINAVTDNSTNAMQNLLSGVGSGMTGVSNSVDLSGRVMDGLGLTKIFTVNTNTTQDLINSTLGIGAFITSFLRLVMFLITIFVFLMLAALLIGRFVMLVLLMATSPIGFIGEVVPKMSTYTKEWWDTLLDQCLIAPIFMFFMLLTVKFAQVFAKMTSVNTSPMILFFNFFLVAYLLLKTVKITKSLSGPMGEYAGKLASMATGAAVAGVTGGTALVGRQVIGRGANALANSATGRRLEEWGSKGGIIGGAANLLHSGIKGTASSTFDMRNTSTFKEINDQAGSISGTKLIHEDYLKAGGIYGKDQTGFSGGFAAKSKKAEETAKAYAKSSSDSEKTDLDKYNFKIASLKRQMEETEDPGKKAKIQKEIADTEKERKAQTSEGIDDKIKEASKPKIEAAEKAIGTKREEIEGVKHMDFGGADTKIKEAQEKLEKKRKEAQDKIFIAQKLGNTRDEKSVKDQLKADEQQINDEIKTLEKQLATARDAEEEKLKKELAELEKERGEILEKTKKEIEDGIRKGTVEATSAQKLIVKRRRMRLQYADSLRKAFLTTNMSYEREPLAIKAEKANYDAEKARDDAAIKKFRDELKKEIEKDQGTK